MMCDFWKKNTEFLSEKGVNTVHHQLLFLMQATQTKVLSFLLVFHAAVAPRRNALTAAHSRVVLGFSCWNIQGFNNV